MLKQGALLGHWRQGVCEEALVGPGMVGDVSWKDRMGHCFDPTVRGSLKI